MEQRGFWDRVLDRLIGFVFVLTNTIALTICAPLYSIGMPILIVVLSIKNRNWDWRVWAMAGEYFWRAVICEGCRMLYTLATEGFRTVSESFEDLARIYDEIENRYYEDEEE